MTNAVAWLIALVRQGESFLEPPQLGFTAEDWRKELDVSKDASPAAEALFKFGLAIDTPRTTRIRRQCGKPIPH